MTVNRGHLSPVTCQLSPKKVRSVPLAPGLWIYVCPCGVRYRVSRVTRGGGNHALYCFHCKRQNGKYYRIMEERIEYKASPNGTLGCECFPMIRLSHPLKNAVGSVKQIYLREVWKGNARIEYTTQVTLSQITAPMSLWMAGVEPERLRRSIREAHRNRPGINWETQTLDFIVLRFLKESKEPTLF